MTDRLLDALIVERENQPDKPEYQVGAAIGQDYRYVAVDRIATNDAPGFEIVRQSLGKGRCYMVVFPNHLTTWLVATLGAYLTDAEWDDAAAEREDEIERRADQ